MKILYVGDNSDRSNWGCRATSIALSEIVSKEHEIIGVIKGREVGQWDMTPISWGGRGPTRILKKIDRVFSDGSKGVKKRLGVKDDFISIDTDKSISNFEKIFGKFKHLQKIKHWVDQCDGIVVNGEGGYILSSPPRRDHLFFNFMVGYAQYRRKRTFVVNGMLSPCPKTGTNLESKEQTFKLFEACDYLCFRDPYSLDLYRELGGKRNADFIPDALFSWCSDASRYLENARGMLGDHMPFGRENLRGIKDFDLSKPFIALGGSSSAAWDQESAFQSYLGLASKLKNLDLPIVCVVTCGGDRFLERVCRDLELPLVPERIPVRLGCGILGRASMFVSGRYHPSILASLNGTPCVFLSSNAHKTRSLQRVLEYSEEREFESLPDDNASEDIVEHVQKRIQNPWDRDGTRRIATHLGKDALRLTNSLA
ncbi:MAG: polysaccharide pyruvyl transferase family protein [Puniceicoccaceae bacterium]